MTNQFIEKEIVIEGETKIFGTLNHSVFDPK